MPSWSNMINHIESLGRNDLEINNYINTTIDSALKKISELRKDRNVIFYSSAFLQKPKIDPLSLQITYEEINGFMAVMHGMQFNKGLVLILHTPGGATNATESVVEYLHSKFTYIEVIVPTFAMSAGTMISLSSDLIIMGRQSQLGPIDPQMVIDGRSVSARSIEDQFEKAKNDVKSDLTLAHVWAPILASMGPGLLIEAQKANEYSKKMVQSWLERKKYDNSTQISEYFNSPDVHKSHGKRIDREEAKNQGLRIEELEADQNLQEAVLTAYHAITIIFEKSPAVKILLSNTPGKRWVKNAIMPPVNIPIPMPMPKQR